jgi:sugar phosphate isomerase/epimerase
MASIPVGIQLYTLRERLKADFAGTLERVADLGLDGVEFAGYGDLPAEEMRALLEKLHLRGAASHVSLERLENDFGREAAYARTVGIGTLVCPWWKEDSGEGWLRLAERLSAIERNCSGAGLGFAYHNHAHELTSTVEGEPALDVMLRAAPELEAELDVAWLHAGGVDPVEYLQRYAGRVPLVHLKDTRRDGEGQWGTLELGSGEVDLEGVLREAGAAGTQWLIIEQDHCPGDPFDSIEQSIAWLRENGALEK